MTKDEQSMEMLPRLMQQLDLLNSESMVAYENKLNNTLTKALELLETTIEDSSLALDPESLVESIKVMSNALHIIKDDKRKLLDTTIRGSAILKAVQDDEMRKKNNEDNTMSVMEKYYRSMLPEGMTIEDTKVNSVFNVEDEVVDDSDSKPSSDN